MRLFARRKGKSAVAAPVRMLQTDRLVLRAFDMGDALDVFAYAKSPVVGPMAGWAPHATLEDSRAALRMFMENGDVWAMVEKKSGRVVGSIGLHKDTKRNVEGVRMLGYALGENWWGQGYATESAAAVLRFAFEELGCLMVSVYHYPHNKRSKRVIEKLGFACDGQLRMASLLPDGSIVDDVCYSLSREEYERG